MIKKMKKIKYCRRLKMEKNKMKMKMRLVQRIDEKDK